MDVVFAVLPFADVSRPAIGVSLLQAEVTRAGFSSCIEYLNLLQTELMGLPTYRRVADGFPPDILLGEWFFADCVFGDAIPAGDDYVSKILRRFCRLQDSLPQDLAKARAQREQFLSECVRRILRHDPQVVGLTTTFHQTCACLAVAQRLKAAPNPPIIVFGGANCEGEMGRQLICSFPWIDYVCAGESDISFPALLEKIRHPSASGPIPGVIERGQSTPPTAAEPVRNLDDLPVPDFTDYFEQVNRSPIQPMLGISLPIETARGCWWGARQHCTFCGLNGDTMAFRSKSPARAFDEMTSLSETYGVKRLFGVDNILDLKYVTTVFPRLEASGLGLELFYEVKTNLRYEQLAALRAGGLRSIQPGIESLSDQVLRLMRKGCTTVQNLQLLRWAEELGIQVGWNILAGFPGESPSEYERMANLVSWLTHLQPPATCSPVRLDRFSPFFSHPDEFGFERVRPHPAYFYVFPLGRQELGRLAYFFDFDYRNEQAPQSYIHGLQSEVQRWWDVHARDPEKKPRLDAEFHEGALVVTDTRELATAPRHHLEGLAAEIYFLCDLPQTFSSLLKHLRAGASQPAIRAALAGLREVKLLLEVGEHFLSLAIFRNRSEHHSLFEPSHAISISKTAPAEPLLRVG